MEVKFAVKRYDPITNADKSTQTYTAEVDEGDMLLDALLQIRDEQDPTLAFRGSCRSGFCGDCTMTVNGKGAIACRTKVKKAWDGAEDGAIELEPLKMSRQMKDLVYNAREFHWNKFRAVEPWVDPVQAPSEGEHLVPGGHDKRLTESMRCTQCGLCDQGCTVLVVDKTFVGPAALTKAYRVVADERDSRKRQRLDKLSLPRGMWDCTHCFEASEHCPKYIEPTDRIFDLHSMAIKAEAGAAEGGPSLQELCGVGEGARVAGRRPSGDRNGRIHEREGADEAAAFRSEGGGEGEASDALHAAQEAARRRAYQEDFREVGIARIACHVSNSTTESGGAS